jgi:hypothetical protein
MSEQLNDFDSSLRKRFSEYQQDPPELVWQNVHAGIAGKLGKEDDKRKWGFIIFLSGLSLLVLFTGAYFGLRTSTTGTANKLADAGTLPSERPIKDQVLPDKPMAAVQHTLQVKSNNHVISKTTSLDQSQYGVEPTQAYNAGQTTTFNAETQSPLEVFNNSESYDLSVTTQQEKPDLLPPIALNSTSTEPVTTLTQAVENPTDPTSQVTITEVPGDSSNQPIVLDTTSTPPDPNHDYGKACNMFLGLKATGGIYHKSANSSDVYSYGAEFNLGYQRRHLLVQTGLGLEFQKQINQYQVNYKAYEATGAYDYVTYYTIDTIPIIIADTLVGYLYRPSFHTKAIAVFDSIDHQENKSNPATYTWINIPLMVGYHWTFNNWGLNLKAGGTYSMLIKKKEAEVFNPEENATLSYLSRLNAVRKKQYFSALIAPEVEYYFSDDISMNIEPWFRYSFQYTTVPKDRSYSLRPWSWGLNAGIKFHF